MACIGAAAPLWSKNFVLTRSTQPSFCSLYSKWIFCVIWVKRNTFTYLYCWYWKRLGLSNSLQNQKCKHHYDAHLSSYFQKYARLSTCTGKKTVLKQVAKPSQYDLTIHWVQIPTSQIINQLHSLGNCKESDLAETLSVDPFTSPTLPFVCRVSNNIVSLV